MSNVTLDSPQLAPSLAAMSPEAAEPLPNEGDDVVEAYSFNTGDWAEAPAARPICIALPAVPAYLKSARNKTIVTLLCTSLVQVSWC